MIKFSPVLMSILTCNIIIVLTVLVFNIKKVFIKVGYKLLIWSTLLIVIRLLLPIELPFSHNIILPTLLSKIISSIRHRFYFNEIRFSVWDIFLGAWLIIAGVKLCKYCHSYCKIKQMILNKGIDITHQEPYASELKIIAVNKKNKFRVVSHPDVIVPCLFGLIQPYILVPSSYKLSSVEISIVLKHETSHHYNHDLLVKVIVDCICIIYWWNPFSKILVKQTDTLLDIRIDKCMTTSTDSTSKTQYLSCLLNIAQRSVQKNEQLHKMTVSVFKNDSSLIKRFYIITESSKRNLPLIMLLLTLTLILYVFSYLFTFEASYYPKVIQEEYIELTNKNTYLIDNNDGTYDLYINGSFIEKIDSLEYYSETIPIYKGKFQYEE